MPENPAIVVIGFNRPKSLKRLLESLKKAIYPSSAVHLIISIDKGVDNDNVREIAEEFGWLHGPKEVIYQQKNLGLREHILKCGDLSSVYDSIIILEDDLYVSPYFYNYACQALQFSVDKDYISGISLYCHKQNVLCHKTFTPLEDGYDNWYFQFASSWGQAWTSTQWRRFKSWYQSQGILKPTPNIPEFVSAWSEKSWLKYFIKYLVEQNKYFLYPKIALCTNFGDSGTHVSESNTDYQVPLFEGNQKTYHFSTLEESGSVYDVFFENTKLYNLLGLKAHELCVDLYGCKKEIGARYILTSKSMGFGVKFSFGRELKPREANIIHNIEGNIFFLYDRKHSGSPPDLEDSAVKETFYETKYQSLRQVLKLAVFILLKKIRKTISRIDP